MLTLVWFWWIEFYILALSMYVKQHGQYIIFQLFTTRWSFKNQKCPPLTPIKNVKKFPNCNCILLRFCPVFCILRWSQSKINSNDFLHWNFDEKSWQVKTEKWNLRKSTYQVKIWIYGENVIFCIQMLYIFIIHYIQCAAKAIFPWEGIFITY